MSKQTQPKANLQTYEQDLASLKKNLMDLPAEVENPDLAAEPEDQEPDQEPEQEENEPMEENPDINQEAEQYRPPPKDPNEIPTDKDGLIEYLKDRLARSEMTMSTVLVGIQIEREKREQLRKELDDKKKELQEVHDSESNFLGEKVQDKMQNALRRAVEDRVLAENEKAEIEQGIQEREFMIAELDETIQFLHKQKCQREVDADEAQYRINEQESIIDSYNQDITNLTKDNLQRDQEISELTAQINDMQDVVQTLMNVRIKLNYYIDGEGSGRPKGAKVPSDNYDKVEAKSPEYMEDYNQRQKKPELPKEDDFWYADPTIQIKPQEQKKGGYAETYPWQPKVQNMNSSDGRLKEGFRTVEYKPPSPTVHLPNIYGKQEYLYKNQEYLDEFGQNNKTLKKKNIQVKKKAY